MALEKYNANIEKCFGCMSCVNNCPTHAILFYQDNKGNFYPKIDKSKCIECKLCDQYCLIDCHDDLFKDTKNYCLYINNNEKEILSSSSGGAFLSIIKYFFSTKKNVVIYGAELTYNPQISLKHTRAESFTECMKFSGSKYIYSDIGSIYKNIVNDYKQKKFIVISGLPCQIAAVKRFVKLKHLDENNMFFIDLICHGVGGQAFFDYFIIYLENKYKSRIIEFKFRDKRISWKGYPCYVKFENGKELKNTLLLRNFPILYLKGLLMRNSCFNCSFSKRERVSDITLGDFWGIEKEKTNIDFSKGASLILFNSEKASNIKSFLKKLGYLEDVQEKLVLENQNNLIKGHVIPSDYKQFWECFRNKGIEKTFRIYGSYNFKNIIRFSLKKIAIILKIYK